MTSSLPSLLLFLLNYEENDIDGSTEVASEERISFFFFHITKKPGYYSNHKS